MKCVCPLCKLVIEDDKTAEEVMKKMVQHITDKHRDDIPDDGTPLNFKHMYDPKNNDN